MLLSAQPTWAERRSDPIEWRRALLAGSGTIWASKEDLDDEKVKTKREPSLHLQSTPRP